jgi:hypothetical protein
MAGLGLAIHVFTYMASYGEQKPGMAGLCRSPQSGDNKSGLPAVCLNA